MHVRGAGAGNDPSRWTRRSGDRLDDRPVVRVFRVVQVMRTLCGRHHASCRSTGRRTFAAVQSGISAKHSERFVVFCVVVASAAIRAHAWSDAVACAQCSRRCRANGEHPLNRETPNSLDERWNVTVRGLMSGFSACNTTQRSPGIRMVRTKCENRVDARSHEQCR